LDTPACANGSATRLASSPMLFTPITLRNVTARNRVVVSPMCQYMSVDGGPVDWHLVHLGRLAMGGAGIVFCEETAVEPRGRKTYQCAGLYNDDHVALYRRITDFIKSVGAVPAMQLGHAGRKGSVRGAMEGWAPLTEVDAAKGAPPWQTISASAIPAGDSAPAPIALDHGEIGKVVATWAEAARRSADAGFEICEIHAAHGYLIHQFLSPLSNHRTDAYGGSRENRMRLALEVTEAVRKAWPSDKPLFYRCASIDGKGGAWDMDDTLALAQALSERGVDVLDCSAGGMSGKSPLAIVPRVPGYQVSYASRVRREIGMKTMAIGLITTPNHAESILQNGDADLVAMARELMYHADWPVHAARELGVPNYLELFPAAYAFRLQKRDEVRALYPPGTATVVPHSVDRVVDYEWPEEFLSKKRS
jgi:2,4-dienoyl-CoA reductase-like NADH-dependent reductase (Old Yellow Enzyme family)